LGIRTEKKVLGTQGKNGCARREHNVIALPRKEVTQTKRETQTKQNRTKTRTRSRTSAQTDQSQKGHRGAPSSKIKVLSTHGCVGVRNGGQLN